jgi:hypothetical protein
MACGNGSGMIMEMAPARGPGASLRTYLRPFRGVHKPYLHLYVATDEAMVNTKRITPTLVRRMCIRDLSAYTGYT